MRIYPMWLKMLKNNALMIIPLVENYQNARGCFSTRDCSVHSLSTNFSCSYNGFTLIRASVIIFLLDLSIAKCFIKVFFNFERVLLATRGCSHTLKTPNSPPLDYTKQPENSE